MVCTLKMHLPVSGCYLRIGWPRECSPSGVSKIVKTSAIQNIKNMVPIRVRVPPPAFWLQRVGCLPLTTCLAQYSHSQLCLEPRLQTSTEVELEQFPGAREWGRASEHWHQHFHLPHPYPMCTGLWCCQCLRSLNSGQWDRESDQPGGRSILSARLFEMAHAWR